TKDRPSGFSMVPGSPAKRLFSSTAGAHHTFGQTLLNYEISFGQARFTGFFPRASFDVVPNGPLDGTVQFKVNNSNPLTPVLTAVNADIFNPSQYVLSSLRRGDDHTFERDVSGAASLARTYKAGSHFSTFETGFKVRDAHKSELDVRQTFKASNLDPSKGTVGLMSNFLGTFTNPDYYFGLYGPFGPTTDYSKIVAFYNANSSNPAIFKP